MVCDGVADGFEHAVQLNPFTGVHWYVSPMTLGSIDAAKFTLSPRLITLNGGVTWMFNVPLKATVYDEVLTQLFASVTTAVYVPELRLVIVVVF